MFPIFFGMAQRNGTGSLGPLLRPGLLGLLRLLGSGSAVSLHLSHQTAL